jgi:hypothetical protein
MGFLWYVYDISMGFLFLIPVGFLWEFHGGSLEFLWAFKGMPLGFPIGFLSDFYGVL